MKIKFDFENCFGIRRLEKEIEFQGKQSVAVIYAPNGMMKSSFANTCEHISWEALETKKSKSALKDDPICDRLNPDAESRHDIKVDGTDIRPESIFVANPDVDFDASQQVTVFLASVGLKKEYDRIVGQIETAKEEFLKPLKIVSKSSDCDLELIKAFSNKEGASIYDCIEAIAAKLKDNAEFYDFKFNNIFDKDGDVKKFLERNHELLTDYVRQYNKLMEKSGFFHSQDGKSFGTYQASVLGKAFKGEEFFTVGHKLMLRNRKKIGTVQEYNEKIKTEKERIFRNEDLRKKFEKLSKQLDVNIDLRIFSDEITQHQDWIPKLANYEDFRIEALLGYINHPDVRAKFDTLRQVYTEKKANLKRVVRESNKEQGRWTEIVDIFNTRFYPPFTVRVQNQENVLLKSEEAKLAFDYRDSDGHLIPQSRESLLRILSKGEKRAFLILQFLFAIEARKKWTKPSLIVMDDISDSFDYQNKYAIIEYIKDIAEKYPEKFKIILLTHNFDFYRSVTLRLKGMVQQFMAVKQNDGTIRIDKGVYVMKTPFELEMKNSEKGSNLVALIPFVRNLVEYYQEKDSPDFMALTGCLHLLNNTETMTDTELVGIILKIEAYKDKLKYEATGERVLDIIFREADQIATGDEVHEIMIEDKVVLSIAIRLKAEMFLKRELKAAGKSDAELATTRNQTSEWIDLYKSLNPPTDKYRTMEKVNMMTPEYIHLNSFMYEPLIDMSVWHLIDLYGEVKALVEN